MSLDGKYILHYDTQSYIAPTPMQLDIDLLRNEYGGEFTRITEFDYFWEKPKHLLPSNDVARLLADQVLELRCDGSVWRDITTKREAA